MALKIGLALVMVLISGVIGFSIIDSVAKDATNHKWSVNESHSNTTSLPQNMTLTYDKVLAGSLTMTGATGTPIVGYNTLYATEGYANIPSTLNTTLNGTTWLFTYAYEGDEYFDSSLSRTIMAYIVPLGLLGMIAIAAGIYL